MGQKLFRLFKIIKRGLLDIIYERESSCILCKKESTFNIICDKCKKDIVRCSDYDIAYGYYKGNLKKLILNFKYNRNFNAGFILAQFLSEKINRYYKDYYIVYIPISKESYKIRKFDQCSYLCEEIEFMTQNNVLKILKRKGNAKIQKKLSRNERIKNVKDIFYVWPRGITKNKKILVIDDVITTGSTLKEAKRVLVLDGAKIVKFLTIAKSNY